MSIRRSNRSTSPIDGAEFGAFYVRHSRGLLAFFVSRVYEPELALDLTAETFAQALLSRHRFRGSSDADARAWLYGIARHQLGRYFRRGSAERRALSQLGIQRPELSQEEHDRVEELVDMERGRKLMAQALEELSADQRNALSLRVVQELPYPEVADRLGITESTARARVSRGLRALSRRLENGPTIEEAT